MYFACSLPNSLVKIPFSTCEISMVRHMLIPGDIIFLQDVVQCTVLLDFNLTYARAHKASARNIHGNAPE